ncbi:MAG: glycosyltransferase family 87 protein [Anaerolineales bacterium]
MKRIVIFLLSSFILILILLVLAIYVPIPIDPFQDFQVLYRADSGVLHGIPLYDQAGQAQRVADELNVSVDKVLVLPFPYPPWYAVFTLPLALFSIDVAVRLWFLLNIAMLLASVWLLSDGWEPRKRLYSFIAAFLFLPIFGALIVGQYVFPTILGMALIVYALKHKTVGWLALGMALITFKPHIGIFLLLAVIVHLLLRRDDFGRRAFWRTVITGIFLFLVGFIADRAWIITYPQSLFNFKNVSECQICVSLPLTVGRIFGLGFDQSAPVAGIIFLALIALFIGSRYRLGDEAFVAFFVCVPLLVNPYLLNYDFSFALVPLFYLAGSARSKMDWLWIALIFLLPWIGLILFERAGNSVLLVCVLAILSIVLTQLYKAHTMTS